MPKEYQHVIVGGTFDHFHKGHQTLLDKACTSGEKVTIGISKSNLFNHKQFSSLIESYSQREQKVKEYCTKQYPNTQVSLRPLTDKYGTTLTDPSIDAIVVSPDTQKVAEEINEERKQKDLSPMTILTVPHVLATDNKLISSERIRQGLINREGFSYLYFFTTKEKYTLPDSLRSTLKDPIGKIVTEVDTLRKELTDATVITVGDIVTTTLLEKNIPLWLGIIDLRTQRQALDTSLKDTYFSHLTRTMINPAGEIHTSIGSSILDAIQDYQASQKTQIIHIDGEEDLLALPAILLSPLTAKVIYGQYGKGMVVVEVTEENKQYIVDLLQQFT